MKNLLLLLLLVSFCAAPAWAQQKRPVSAKTRKAQLAATAAARAKAERERRAAEAARLAAAMPVSEGPDAQELLRIDKELADATLRSDAETITHLLADEYIAVNSQGAVTGKSDVLGAIANDQAKCDINAGFEFVVRVYGNTGLVIHNTSFRGKLNGVNTSGEYRVTRYFIRRNGKWLIAASHTTYVVPPKSAALANVSTKKMKREKKKEKSAFVNGRDLR